MTGARDADGLEHARALIQLGRFHDAGRMLADVIAAHPERAHPHCLMAQCLLELGDEKGALDSASAALALQPESEYAHRLRAVALVRLKRPHDAVQAAQQAVALAPDLLPGYFALCDAALAARDVPLAATAAATAVRLDPASPKGHDALGRVALARKRPAEAEQHFRTALGIAPADAGVLNNLGVALHRQGRHKQAVHYFGEASKLDPRSSLPRRNAVSAAQASSAIATVVIVIISWLLVSATEAKGWALLPASMLGAYVAVRRFRPLVIRNPEAGDPRASRELMRALQREANPNREGIGWVFRTLGLSMLVIISALVVLAAVGGMSQGAWVAGPIALFLGGGGLWLGMALVGRRRAHSRQGDCSSSMRLPKGSDT